MNRFAVLAASLFIALRDGMLKPTDPFPWNEPVWL